MKEKVLFFDIDGTLVDNTYGVYEVPESVKESRMMDISYKFIAKKPHACVWDESRFFFDLTMT